VIFFARDLETNHALMYFWRGAAWPSQKPDFLATKCQR